METTQGQEFAAKKVTLREELTARRKAMARPMPRLEPVTRMLLLMGWALEDSSPLQAGEKH